jgi:hypothetical protein
MTPVENSEDFSTVIDAGIHIMNSQAVAASTGRGTHSGTKEIGLSETIKLSGHVTSGRGVATSNIRRNVEAIRNALGVTVVEGSLNLLLKHPVMLANDTAIPVFFDTGAPRLEWRGKLNGVDVWLSRWQTAPLHIVELLSTVHLRRHLHLSDGDDVQIEVRKCDVAHISNVGRLTWSLFWLGRTDWFYKHNSYCARAHGWCRRFGATQLGTEKNCRDLSVALTKALIKRISGAHHA